MPNQEHLTYEVNIGNKVRSGIVFAELWNDGECTSSASHSLNSTTTELSISILRDDTPRVSVNLSTDDNSDTLVAAFALPPNVIGHAFKAYADQEVLEINAGEERILGAMAFDTGDGVQVIEFTRLGSDPSYFDESPCILIIRFLFTDDAHPPQAE